MDGTDQSKPAASRPGAQAPVALPGGPRAAIEALVAAIDDDAPAVLGIVVETEGSTYVKAGAMLLFGGAQRIGWISGGCLEPGLEAEAAEVATQNESRCIELDTRADSDLFFGSRLGCRGLLRVLLLPTALLAPLRDAFAAWSRERIALDLHIDARRLTLAGQGASLQWDDSASAIPAAGWPVHVTAAPRLLLLGAGPESASLVPWLRQLGWYVDLVERRPRWREAGALADGAIQRTPAAVTSPLDYDAALVMNHDFELDRDALERLAGTAIGFIGLLGPPARRDDLLALLPPAAQASLRPRLHAPVGLDLGGRGPEAIALAIVAQLQSQVIAAHSA